ncbi:MAG: hypothetical protein Q7W45_10070 [Bacteroidota bacterium]|nr:hypothetical protein [Bacteroidota bacterium]MDP3147193.1 hypothetical protein [Bacteroidota bacterium]
MDKENILHKEIDLIQGIITRMANNSFLLKGWIVSLIAVLLALTDQTIVATKLTYFNLILILPVIVFWYLDAFFLHKEKCYRRLYNWTVSNRTTSDEHLYSLDYTRFENDEKSIWTIMFTNKTLFPFYGLLALILAILAIHNLVV